MDVEAVVLTGGRSSRMGRDKATIRIDGVAMAERIVSQIQTLGLPVTVLGPHRVPATPTVEDAEPFAGPLVALARFVPRARTVLVSSCDLPRFDPAIIGFLASRIGDRDAAVPFVDGFPQPLCALYDARAFPVAVSLVSEGGRSMMAWLDRLKWARVDAADMEAAGIDPGSTIGVNSDTELSKTIGEAQ